MAVTSNIHAGALTATAAAIRLPFQDPFANRRGKQPEESIMIEISRQPLPPASELPANWAEPDESTTDAVPADVCAAPDAQAGDPCVNFEQLFGLPPSPAFGTTSPLQPLKNGPSGAPPAPVPAPTQEHAKRSRNEGSDQPARADGAGESGKYSHTKGKNFYNTRHGDASVERGMDVDRTLKSNGIKFKGEPANLSKSEEAALKGAVVALAVTNDISGYETDVKLNIDGKTRYATIRIDDSGNATATLLPAKAQAIPPGTAQEAKLKADWTKRLEKDFGVKIDEKNTTHWKSDELAEMHRAFSTLSAGEKHALEGVTIMRTDQIPATDQEGNPAGLYQPRVFKDGDNGTTILIDDDAIKTNKTRFVGDEKTQWMASTQVVMHEVGHAIADRKRLDAEITMRKAETAYFGSKDTYRLENRKLSAYDDVMHPMPAAAKAFSAEADKLENLINQRDHANLAANKKAQLDQQITAQVAKRDAAWAKMQPEDQKNMLAMKNGQDATIKNIPELEKANAAWDAAKQSQPTLREKTFADFVKGAKILPFTDYAAKSAKKGDMGEFYAEAFSIYKLDRQFMQNNYPDLVKWFDGGNHVQ